MRTLTIALIGLCAPVLWPTSLSAADTRPAMPTKPCAQEDSRGPCFWDAGRRGNHRGYSFWVDRHNRIHYLDPRRNR